MSETNQPVSLSNTELPSQQVQATLGTRLLNRLFPYPYEPHQQAQPAPEELSGEPTIITHIYSTPVLTFTNQAGNTVYGRETTPGYEPSFRQDMGSAFNLMARVYGRLGGGWHATQDLAAQLSTGKRPVKAAPFHNAMYDLASQIPEHLFVYERLSEKEQAFYFGNLALATRLPTSEETQKIDTSRERTDLRHYDHLTLSYTSGNRYKLALDSPVALLAGYICKAMVSVRRPKHYDVSHFVGDVWYDIPHPVRRLLVDHDYQTFGKAQYIGRPVRSIVDQVFHYLGLSQAYERRNSTKPSIFVNNTGWTCIPSETSAEPDDHEYFNLNTILPDIGR